MDNAWKHKALEIGKSLHEAAQQHPELTPLCTSWMNFARKHHLHQHAGDAAALRTLLDRHGLTIIHKGDIDSFQATITSQAEEIKALEYRIATLLRPGQ